MTIARSNRWRIALIAAGATMAIGGPLHPESDAADPMRDELATMTAGDTWVLSHSLVAIGTALLAAGLWSAYRNRAWPESTTRTLRWAAIAMSAYVVETVAHLAAVVDSDALAAGDPAPVAFGHLGLAAVLYPVSGIALAVLGVHLFRAVGTAEKVFGVVAVVGGTVHALSVPLTLLLPDVEMTPAFAAAGMLLASFALGTGISGLRTAGRAMAVTTPAVAVSVAR